MGHKEPFCANMRNILFPSIYILIGHVCLFVCPGFFSESAGRTRLKLGGWVWLGPTQIFQRLAKGSPPQGDPHPVGVNLSKGHYCKKDTLSQWSYSCSSHDLGSANVNKYRFSAEILSAKVISRLINCQLGTVVGRISNSSGNTFQYDLDTWSTVC